MFNQVLDFWFKDIEPAMWFQKDLAFDAQIVERFSDLHRQAVAGELYTWRTSALGRLAEVIVLDQFSRNMFRDDPQSFAYDPLALVLAQEAVAVGADQELTAIERNFLYMPYMHSESLLIHDQAVALFTANGIQNTLDYEILHRDIIVQFGRYPHRNTVLKRVSTDEEKAFLLEPGSSF